MLGKALFFINDSIKYKMVHHDFWLEICFISTLLRLTQGYNQLHLFCPKKCLCNNRNNLTETYNLISLNVPTGQMGGNEQKTQKAALQVHVQTTTALCNMFLVLCCFFPETCSNTEITMWLGLQPQVQKHLECSKWSVIKTKKTTSKWTLEINWKMSGCSWRPRLKLKNKNTTGWCLKVS